MLAGARGALSLRAAQLPRRPRPNPRRQPAERWIGSYETERRVIGNREIVGFGINSNPIYVDEPAFPFPAIRYRECTPELMAIREKERGDWRKLSVCEKKFLYRSSFRQTFAEMDAPSSEWKSVLAGVLVGVSLAAWLMMFVGHYVHKPWPESFKCENRIAQYYRMIEINHQPITGVYRPCGAQKRVFPKNKQMLEEIMEKQAKPCE